MTTETTCLSSIWITDDEVKHHYEIHNRPEDYKELQPGDVAYYDGMIRIDLSTQESMIALPFHPSNAYTIHELQENPAEILRKVEEDAKKRFGDKVNVSLIDKIVNGKVVSDQGIIAGCSGGTYDNLSAAATILKGQNVGNDYFTISAYPQSTPVYMAATRNGIAEELLEAKSEELLGSGDALLDTFSNDGAALSDLSREMRSRLGYYAFVCEKCAPTFSYYGYFLAAERLKDRSDRLAGML